MKKQNENILGEWRKKIVGLSLYNVKVALQLYTHLSLVSRSYVYIQSLIIDPVYSCVYVHVCEHTWDRAVYMSLSLAVILIRIVANGEKRNKIRSENDQICKETITNRTQLKLSMSYGSGHLLAMPWGIFSQVLFWFCWSYCWHTNKNCDSVEREKDGKTSAISLTRSLYLHRALSLPLLLNHSLYFGKKNPFSHVDWQNW